MAWRRIHAQLSEPDADVYCGNGNQHRSCPELCRRPSSISHMAEPIRSTSLNARISGIGLLSNSPAPPTSDGSTELYNSVVGWTTANGHHRYHQQWAHDTASSSPTRLVLYRQALRQTPRLSRRAPLRMLQAPHDNWIKIDTPTTTTGVNANVRVRQRDRSTGAIRRRRRRSQLYLTSFYDSTTQAGGVRNR